MIEQPTSNHPEEQDLFADEYLKHQDATTGQRFGNFFIDVVIVMSVFKFAAGFLIAAVSPDTSEAWFQNGSIIGQYVISYMISAVLFLIYYPICEVQFKGVTLGKLITGTRAVNNDYTELSWKTAFVRTLCRLVPFEVFSGFGGHPWHDQWTETQVIKTR